MRFSLILVPTYAKKPSQALTQVATGMASFPTTFNQTTARLEIHFIALSSLYTSGSSFPSQLTDPSAHSHITLYERTTPSASLGISTPIGLFANRLALRTIPLLADTRLAQAFRWSLMIGSATAICAGVTM
ncbi:hypothetical protein [Capsulimonas corticalis]|uniref:hypothetical protein n=1 Tax=Capsulimonas corticalis TaxID=2219043 RepID=UPI0026343D78|nr:hypothetical protein [Capsulimonas corticalis]